MDLSISCWRGMRAAHQSEWSVVAREELSGDFPFLPIRAEGFVELFAQRLQLGLPILLK